MLAVFTTQSTPRGQISLPPTLAWWRQQIQSNVTRLQEYLAGTAQAVQGNHPLVQAIEHLGSPNLETTELYNLADSRYSYVSKNLKFTTEFNRGTFLGHRIYPVDNNMIYGDSDYISPFQAVRNWRTQEPVTCMWSGKAYVDMSIPRATDPVTLGFCSTRVDMPLLSVMYKGFKESQGAFRRDYGQGPVLGSNHFVAMHVLPNILKTQVDLSCVSALMALYYGNYQVHDRVDTNIYLPSYSDGFQRVGKQILERLSDSRMQYMHMLQHIPSVFSSSGLEALKLPDFAETTQVDWAMLCTRLPVIIFLLDIGGANGRRANHGFIQQLKAYVRDVKSSRIPYTLMSQEMASLVENSISRISRL